MFGWFYEFLYGISKTIFKVIDGLILCANKLCGIESQGMILASGEEDVRVVFLADDTPLGERVR